MQDQGCGVYGRYADVFVDDYRAQWLYIETADPVDAVPFFRSPHSELHDSGDKYSARNYGFIEFRTTYEKGGA